MDFVSYPYLILLISYQTFEITVIARHQNQIVNWCRQFLTNYSGGLAPWIKGDWAVFCLNQLFHGSCKPLRSKVFLSSSIYARSRRDIQLFRSTFDVRRSFRHQSDRQICSDTQGASETFWTTTFFSADWMKGAVPLQTWKSPCSEMILVGSAFGNYVKVSKVQTSFYFLTEKVQHPQPQVEKLNKRRTLLTQHKGYWENGTDVDVSSVDGRHVTYGNQWLALAREAFAI